LPLGKFLPSQIVDGAILTCRLNALFDDTCFDPRLNGFRVGGDWPEANEICRVVFGSPGFPGGSAPQGPVYVWNGSSWALGWGFTLNELVCRR
jgi:hypothetical protein